MVRHQTVGKKFYAEPISLLPKKSKVLKTVLLLKKYIHGAHTTLDNVMGVARNHYSFHSRHNEYIASVMVDYNV